jgi:hypothetical protein
MAWNEVLAALGIMVTIGLKHWDDVKARRKVAEAINERDQRLLFVLIEHRPHTHGETEHSQVLKVEGIRYPAVKFNGHS